jgi:hypothetical protein
MEIWEPKSPGTLWATPGLYGTALPYSQCIFSLLMYVVNNRHLFTGNVEVHNHEPRSAKNFHLPITNLTLYQKGAYYTGILCKCLFVFLPLQPTVVVFSQPRSGL